MALAETVCMSLTEYQQFTGFTVGLSMIIGFAIGAWTMSRRMKKRYISRGFIPPEIKVVDPPLPTDE